MTDEDRVKLCYRLRHPGDTALTALKASECRDAADELERLAAALKEAKRHDMRDWHDALERGRKNPI
jgi:hypothetical protein